MSTQIHWLIGIVLAAFGLLACFLPSGSWSDAASSALNSLAGVLFDRAMQSGRGEKSVSLIFSLFSGNSLFRVSRQGCKSAHIVAPSS
jgi:hypothetical protein